MLDEYYLYDTPYWEEDIIDQFVTLSIPKDIAEKVKNFAQHTNLTSSIYVTIATSLVIANQVSIERGAHIANMPYSDFIYFLEQYDINWVQEEDINYEKSMNHLISLIDEGELL